MSGGVPAGEGRRRRDSRAIAMRAAAVCLDEDVRLRDAMERFGIGWVTLSKAITQLRSQRAAAAAARSAP